MIRYCTCLITFLILVMPDVEASILIVGKNQPYDKIKQAIANASPFDTIKVKTGRYFEHTIIVDKPVYITGDQKPVIDAGFENAEIFIILADSVVIEGFVLSNVGSSYLHEFAAVKVKHCADGIIRNNNIIACNFGIYLEYTNNYLISTNNISGKTINEASAGNAIHAWKAKNLDINHNIVQGHRDGIYFEFVDSSRISFNKSHNNLRYGLHFMFSNNDQYRQNEFINNGAGVAVMFSKNIQMNGNLFANNWGGASYGLLLKEISDGKIENNNFFRNTTAILAEGANRIVINKNQFTQNGTALNIKGNCLDNYITLNNFLTNTFEVVTNSRYNNNVYDSNYWSKYSGYDLNRDGTGDVSYRPVNLFAKIIDEIPAATILLNSFLVNLIELTENIFPELIPDDLIDDNPRMKPYDL